MDLMSKYLALARKGKEPDNLNKLCEKLSGSNNSSNYIEDVLKIFPRSKIVEMKQGRSD
jgi:hypothetical protein